LSETIRFEIEGMAEARCNPVEFAQKSSFQE